MWMGLIFYMSSQNATASSNTSGQFAAEILKIFYPDFNSLSAERQKLLVSSIQFIVRKSAHFTIFAVLGGLSFLTFISYNGLKLKTRLSVSAAVCLVYAVSDEFHQYFVPGRSCELRDVLIDFSGSLAAILIFYFIRRASKPHIACKKGCKE